MPISQKTIDVMEQALPFGSIVSYAPRPEFSEARPPGTYYRAPITDDLSKTYAEKSKAPLANDHPFIVDLIERHGEDHPIVKYAREARPWESDGTPPPASPPQGPESPPPGSPGATGAVRQTMGIAAAFDRGYAQFSQSLEDISQGISATTGLPYNGVFAGVRDYANRRADYFQEKLGQTALTEEIIWELIGGSIPGIAEFVAGIPFAASRGWGREYSKEGNIFAGLRGATHDTIHRYIMGKILHAANQLNYLARSIAMGTVGAVASQGGARERARGAGVMVGLGLTAGPAAPGTARMPMVEQVGEIPQALRPDLVMASASSGASRRPLKTASVTEAPGTHRPSRQVSPESPPEAELTTRTRESLTAKKEGIGKEEEGISRIQESVIEPREFVKPPPIYQMTNDLNKLRQQAKEIEGKINGELKEIADNLGLKNYVVQSRTKSDDSIQSKLDRRRMGNPNFEPHNMTDYAGARIFDNPEQYGSNIIQELEQRGYEVMGAPENFYESPGALGYRGIHQELRGPNGHVFELQLHDTAEREHLESSWNKYQQWREVEREYGEIPADLLEQFKKDNETIAVGWEAVTQKVKRPPGKIKAPVKTKINPAGNVTTVKHLGGEDQVQYAVVDVNTLQPSHLVTKGFAKNPNYPKGIQPRPYHKDKVLQGKVYARSNPGAFHPPFLITDNPDAINGPPIVTKDGTVIGGNSRAMLLKTVYDQGGLSAEAYKTRLNEMADSFGVKTGKIKNPVLVRVLSETPENLAKTAQWYNEPFTMGLEGAAEAVGKGRMVSHETLTTLADNLEDFNTLREFLGSTKSKQTIQNLIRDGAIEETQINRYVAKKTGMLTEDGKRLVEATLRGKVVEDYDLLEALPGETLQKVDRILPAMARLQARGEEWDITPYVSMALEDLLAFKATDFRTVDEFLQQGEMFAVRHATQDPQVYGLLKALAEWRQLEIKDGFNELARAAGVDVKGQKTLGFYQPESFTDSFGRIFGYKTPARPGPSLVGAIGKVLGEERGAVILKPEEVRALPGEPLVRVLKPKEAKAKGEQLLKALKEPLFGQIPDVPVDINWRRIQTGDDIIEVVETVKRMFPEDVLRAKGYESQQQTQALAEEMGLTPAQLIDMQGGGALRSSEIAAMRTVHLSAARKLKALADQAYGPRASQLNMFRFRRQLAVFQAVQQQFFRFRAEAGRALSAWRIMATEGKAIERELQTMLEAHGGEAWAKELASMIAMMDKPSQVSKFARQAQKATGWDMLLEYWINSLLSGPQTHAVNMTSTALTGLWQIPERLLASQIGKALGDQEIMAEEAVHLAYGMVEGLKDGWRLAWQAFKTGEPTDPLSKIEMRRYRSITSENLEASGMFGRAVDLMGEAIRTPGRFLMSEDEFFKSVFYRAELQAQASRQTSKEGLTGMAKAERMQEIINNPPDDIKLAAADFSRYATFTQALSGPSKYIQRMTLQHPVLKLIAPFVRTPANIARFGILERTPLGFASKVIREDIAAGGARRDLALARMALGSTIGFMVASWLADGTITGGGPAHREHRALMRKSGWQPYSIRIGDKYYSYHRLEPLGMILGMAADCGEMVQYLKQDEADQLAAMVVMAISKNITSKTYMRGISELINTLSDPDRYGAEYIKRLSGTVIPTGIAQWERVDDPVMREAWGIMDHLKSRWPGMSEDLPPRRDLSGEVVNYEHTGFWPFDMINPVYQQTITNDPVAVEMLENQVYRGMPAKEINGVPLTAKEYSRYVELAGKPMWKALQDLIKSPEYQRESPGKDGGRDLLIRSHINHFRELAKDQMMDEFQELAALVEQEQERRETARMPQF